MYTQQHITAKGALLLHYDAHLEDSENKLASLINFISLKVMHALLYMFLLTWHYSQHADHRGNAYHLFSSTKPCAWVRVLLRPSVYPNISRNFVHLVVGSLESGEEVATVCSWHLFSQEGNRVLAYTLHRGAFSLLKSCRTRDIQ